MKYYKVKPEYDNKTRYKLNCGQLVSDGILIANELYTEKEYQRLANYNGWFEEIDINKNNTYFFFGARFQK